MTKKKTGSLDEFKLAYEDMPENHLVLSHVNNRGNIRKYLTKKPWKNILDFVKGLKERTNKNGRR